MAFDPAYPPTNAEIESAPLRSQLNGLKALIDAIVTITAAQVDGVTSLPPTDPATVSWTLTGATLHLTFGIPKGEMGPPGPPFANALIDSVTTVGPADPAAAGVTFDGTNLRFSFAIPRGIDGNPGATGGDGPQGIQGIQGPPGEVTTAALAAAIAGTSSNTNTVNTLVLGAPASYDQGQQQDLIEKVNELIVTLRR